MRIEKNCIEGSKASKLSIGEIAIGVIFRYGNLEYGPYLRVDDGIVDLGTNLHIPFPPQDFLPDYIELTEARLVTGEK